jgi:hypothetical protein
MRVIPPDDLWVPELNAAVAKGKPVDLPDDLARRLIAQGWSRSKAEKAPRKERAKTPPAGPEPGTKPTTAASPAGKD